MATVKATVDWSQMHKLQYPATHPDGRKFDPTTDVKRWDWKQSQTVTKGNQP